MKAPRTDARIPFDQDEENRLMLPKDRKSADNQLIRNTNE